MKQVYFILLLLILTACSGGLNNHNKGNDHQNLEPNVLNLSAMYSDGEKIISFPVWFNDSIIKVMNDFSLNMSVYKITFIGFTSFFIVAKEFTMWNSIIVFY